MNKHDRVLTCEPKVIFIGAGVDLFFLIPTENPDFFLNVSVFPIPASFSLLTSGAFVDELVTVLLELLSSGVSAVPMACHVSVFLWNGSSAVS